MKVAWYLNLDADDELRAPTGYTPTLRVRAQTLARVSRATTLTGDEPVWQRDQLTSEHCVFCWCPTPRALRELGGQRLLAVPGPKLEILRRANHRRLSVGFGSPELARRFVEPSERWRELLFDEHAASGCWRLKRAFGWAGRGQRRVSATPSADDIRWVEDSMKQGGVLREAEAMIVEEYSVHGYVDADDLIVGRPVRFTTDSFGAPTWFAPLLRDDPECNAALAAAARAVASKLRSLGYFGPFGVDAFSWRGAGGSSLNAVSDINARFTLAWSLGMGPLRERALSRYATRALHVTLEPARAGHGFSPREG